MFLKSILCPTFDHIIGRAHAADKYSLFSNLIRYLTYNVHITVYAINNLCLRVIILTRLPLSKHIDINYQEFQIKSSIHIPFFRKRQIKIIIWTLAKKL